MKKTILITGGARRVGAFLAKSFAKAGFDIAVHYNNSEDEVKALEKEVLSLGVKIKFYKGDLRDEGFLSSLVSNVREDFSKIDVLINNASIFCKKNFLASSFADFNDNFAVHVKAPFFLSLEFAKQKIGSQIINITDTRVVNSKTVFFPYLLSKKSLANLTEMLGSELAPKVKVNEVALGKVLPSLNMKDDISDEEIVKRIPAGKLADLEQVFKTIKFIIENEFYGQRFFIDGGEHLI